MSSISRGLLLLVGLSFTIGVPAVAQAADPLGPLVLRIEPATLSVAVGEPVVLRLYLECVASKEVRIPSKLFAGGTVWFDVFEASGRKRTYFGEKFNLKPFTRDEFVGLAPRGFLGREFTVSGLYQFDQPGEFTIVASWHNDDNAERYGFTAWTGVLHSNTVRISVTPGSR